MNAVTYKNKLLGCTQELSIERDGYKEMMLKAFDNVSASSSSAPKGMISALMAPNTKVLQDQIIELTKQNADLKQLERFRPQLMELQQRLTASQEELREHEAKKGAEIKALKDLNQELTTALTFAKKNVDISSAEAEETRNFARGLTAKIEEMQANEVSLRAELDAARKEVEELRAKAPDSKKIEELESRISDITGAHFTQP